VTDERGASGTSSFICSGGNLFTFFLTAPVQAFCRVVGVSSTSHPLKLQQVIVGKVNWRWKVFIFMLSGKVRVRLRGYDIVLLVFVQVLLDQLEKAVSELAVNFGESLAAAPSIDPTWGRLLGDPFLRHMVFRYEFFLSPRWHRLISFWSLICIVSKIPVPGMGLVDL
jgi:hypothetical protein